MSDSHYETTYLVETPLPLETVAEVMAGEQSCGTFTRVEGETDELRERARADVITIRDLGEVAHAVRARQPTSAIPVAKRCVAAKRWHLKAKRCGMDWALVQWDESRPRRHSGRLKASAILKPRR